MSAGPPRLRRAAVVAPAVLLLTPLAPAAVLLGRAPPAHAQAPAIARASAVKAAFLSRFGSFVEWPAAAFRGPDDPLVIGVYGDDAVASELEQLVAGRRLERRPLEVRRVRDAADLRRVHILFAGGLRRNRIREVLAAARGPVLTVSDGPVAGHPAVLHFVEDEGRVRFGASLVAADARGLKLSARLLAVAQRVEGR